MSPAACPHGDAHIAQQVCRHLYQGEVDDYSHRFTGVGLDYDLICPACAERGDPPASDLVRVCAPCFEETTDRAAWSVGERAVLSEPAILERSTRLGFVHEIIRLPVSLGADLLDLQPRPGEAASRWLGVTSAGALVALDLGARSWKPVTDLAAAIDLDHDVALSVSPDGEMAAVVEATGASGVVVDLASGSITMLLDRGPDRVEGARFPVSFAQVGGRMVLVYGTGWNRLDAFDPRTGALLTRRPAEDKGARHESDYVSSTLVASPRGRWLADNGMNSQGAGIPAAFRLEPWLAENPFEADDGPSRRYLCQRWDYWDGPVCWIGDTTLAVWGYGPDRRSMVAAVLLFDVASGDVDRWFAGPRGPLIYDEYLFSLGDGDGVSVWDVDTGERILHDAGFHPLRYHPSTRQFLTTNPGGNLFVVSRLVGEPQGVVVP